MVLDVLKGASGGRPRLCVFDLDGTLIDSLPDLAASLREMLASFDLIALRDIDIRPMIGDGIDALVRRALSAAGGAGIDHGLAVGRYRELYEPRATMLTRPYPGVEKVLAGLEARGMACAVCTNKPIKAARNILEIFGLLGCLVTVSGGDSFDVRKPDPAHVGLTVSHAGFRPSDAIMIGDHRNDIAAGNGAGLRTIFARWGYGTPDMGAAATVPAELIVDVPAIIQGWSS